MTKAITMKVTLGALAGLISYCENKKMKMANIQAHVSNIAFIELNHPAFAYAKDLLNEAADKRRTYAGVANCIQAAITEINRAIDAAHAEALEMAEVVDLAVTKIKYGVDHYQAICNVRNETHRMITEAIARHDPIGARSAMVMHLNFNRNCIRKLYDGEWET